MTKHDRSTLEALFICKQVDSLPTNTQHYELLRLRVISSLNSRESKLRMDVVEERQRIMEPTEFWRERFYIHRRRKALLTEMSEDEESDRDDDAVNDDNDLQESLNDTSDDLTFEGDAGEKQDDAPHGGRQTSVGQAPISQVPVQSTSSGAPAPGSSHQQLGPAYTIQAPIPVLSVAAPAVLNGFMTAKRASMRGSDDLRLPIAYIITPGTVSSHTSSSTSSTVVTNTQFH